MDQYAGVVRPEDCFKPGQAYEDKWNSSPDQSGDDSDSSSQSEECTDVSMSDPGTPASLILNNNYEEPNQELDTNISTEDGYEMTQACIHGDVDKIKQLLNKGQDTNLTFAGLSLLSLCAYFGHFDIFELLLASGCSVDDGGEKGTTPLMIAVCTQQLDVVKFLIEHDADVNAATSNGKIYKCAINGKLSVCFELPSDYYAERWSTLTLASLSGNLEIVQELLDAGADVDGISANFVTPLVAASQAGHKDVVKLLIVKGNFDLRKRSSLSGIDAKKKRLQMYDALNEACLYGHINVVQILLAAGSEVSVPAERFESPFLCAASNGCIKLAKLLLKKGADVSNGNKAGYTPLMQAAKQGHMNMVYFLLQRGAEINALTNETKETALTIACCGGYSNIVRALVKAGADIELGADTPLMVASEGGHEKIVNYLLRSGAKVNAKTEVCHHTALSKASENGNTKVVHMLLKSGAKTEIESAGETPLMKAVRAGYLDIVKCLVSAGSNLNKLTSTGQNALSIACIKGHFSIVKFLLLHGADPRQKFKDNTTVLVLAAQRGYTAIVKLLLDYLFNHSQPSAIKMSLQSVNYVRPAYEVYVHPSLDVDSQTTTSGDTALTLAASAGNEEIVRLLVSQGAAVNHKNKNGYNSLMLSAYAGYRGIVEVLVSYMADLEACTPETKDTALSLACKKGHHEVVAVLLHSGANEEHRNSCDFTPVCIAAGLGHVHILELLLSHGANIDSSCSSRSGITPLMLAAKYGHVEAVELLLNVGFDINAKSKKTGRTPLIFACFKKKLAVVQVLISRNADFNLQSKNGITPLMAAAISGDVKIGHILIQCGADVNAQCNSGDTALTMAVGYGCSDFVLLLLKNNASIHIRNNSTLSALDLAISGGRVNIAKLLLFYGVTDVITDDEKISYVQTTEYIRKMDIMRQVYEDSDLNCDNLEDFQINMLCELIEAISRIFIMA